MKSTTYEDLSGAAQKGPPELPIDPDIVETILVERPLTLGIIEQMQGVARSRVVGANAKWVYLWYLLRGNHGDEKESMRATAKALNMPFETFRRARKELSDAHVIIPVGTGHYWAPRRLLVRDISEVTQNESDPTQNESTDEVTQNESLGVARVSRVGKVKVLISSKNRYKNGGVTTKVEDRETLSDEGHSFDDLDEAFGPPPKVQRASAPTKPFKLQPPPGPQTESASPRAKGQKVQWQFYPKMFEVCYGVTTSTQQYALGQVVRGRIGRAIQNLTALGADLTRLGEFLTWWKTWAKSRPSPENVVTHWMNAMEQVEEEIRKQTNTWVGSLNDVSGDEYEKIVRGLKERTQREYKGVSP